MVVCIYLFIFAALDKDSYKYNEYKWCSCTCNDSNDPTIDIRAFALDFVKYLQEIMGSNSDNGSFWKPPMLKRGAYDVWADQMQEHVGSVDGQCWSIIKKGDLKFLNAKNEEIPEDDWTEVEFKKFEKNSRAKKLITAALSPEDQFKVLSFKSAKEKWDALKKIHQGNQDVKRDKIIALEEEFNSLQM